MKQIFFRSSTAFVLATLLWGCGGSSGGGTSSSKATVKFVNGIPDSTAIDFSLNEQVTAASIAYGAATASFASSAAGDDDLTIGEHGQIQSLWSQAGTLSANTDYLIIAAGIENYSTELAKRPQLIATTVNRTAPNGSKSTIYVVNDFTRASGTDDASIDFSNPGLNPTFDLQAIAPFSTSSFTVDSGTQDFQVRHAGTDQVFVTDQMLALGAGHVYLALVTGIEGATGATAPAIKLIDLGTK